MSKKISCYDYTVFVDDMLAKNWVLSSFGSEPLIWEDYHDSISSCCGVRCQVRTMSFGRLIGKLEICDRCFEQEKKFIEFLMSFDETEDLILDEGLLDTRSLSHEQMESLKKHKLSKEEKKRKELEKLGQIRLF